MSVVITSYAPLRHVDTSPSFLRASTFLGASQHARGARAEALGWTPKPVVLDEWAEAGITAALEKQQQ